MIFNPDTNQWEDEPGTTVPADYNPYTDPANIPPPSYGSPWAPGVIPTAGEGDPDHNPYWGDAPWPPPTTTVTPTPTPTPTPNPNPTNNGTSGGGGGFGSPSSFAVSSSWPQFHAPPVPEIAPLEKPAPFSFQPFSFESYRAPTGEEAAAEPGWQFGLEQGLGAMKTALASHGTYRTGATPKAFFDYANRSAEQNYGNVYNRSANTYALNRNNAFAGWQANETAAENAYAQNWGVQKDTFGLNRDTTFGTYDRNLQGKLAEFNPQFQAASLTFDDLFRRWAAGLDSTTRIATAGAAL